MVTYKTALENRVSGDALLNAYDLWAELKAAGAEVDVFGNVTLFHYTSHKNGTLIWETRRMKSLWNAVFFSTNGDIDSQASGFGDYVLRFHIQVEKLVLDDVFCNEAHVYVPMHGKKYLPVGEYLCTVHRM